MTKAELYCLTNEELNNFIYPNLIAEVRETTYSICTIADHMGLSRPYRKEDDAETWDKLTGKRDLLCGEAFGLSQLFNVSPEYLYSKELKTVNGKTAAYSRRFDAHEKQRNELEQIREIRKIERELREKPYLLEFMKVAVTLNNEQIDTLVNELCKRKNRKKINRLPSPGSCANTRTGWQ